MPEAAARHGPDAGETTEARALRILRDHARTLERVVASYARSEADRNDLTQEIAIALWSALPSFRGEASERTFLFRIAHNRALTFASRRGTPSEDIDDHADRVVATSGKNPAVVMERAERGSRLLAAVRALPVAQRQVMTMVLEGLGNKEIAEVLGVTENVVGVRANRARAALRVLLEDNDDDEGDRS